jgi:FtsP/CotA-like multicopper oxidase with cupredoxin domain
MIANDGNILEHAVAFDGKTDFGWGLPQAEWKGQLPSQTIAERYDIVVDFAPYPAGTKLYFVNTMEHQDGKGTHAKILMADIVSGKYNPVVQNGAWVGGDPGVGKFMELRVQAYAGTDLSMKPADYEPGGKTMLPVPFDRTKKCTTALDGACVSNGDVTVARHHTMDFVRSQAHGGLGTPWQIAVDGGPANVMDPHRVSTIQHGDVEVWTIKGAGGWTHPVHVHFEEGILLSRGGKLPPPWELYGKKDMYRVGPEGDSTTVIETLYRARDFLGDYVMHCHNTNHEDNAMLMRWDARTKGAALAPTPIPTFDGVFFDPSFELPLADTGDGIGPKISGVPLQ